MNKQIKIDLTFLLGENYTDYGVILTDHHPEVVFTKQSQTQPVESYLWYPIELGQIPNTFTSYFREKLAVPDPAEAQQIIHDWNTKHIPSVNIVKQFKIGKNRFAAIEEPEHPEMLMVLANYSDRPAGMKTVRAGRGGYIWQRQPKTGSITHTDLQSKFCLRSKPERKRFLDKW